MAGVHHIPLLLRATAPSLFFAGKSSYTAVIFGSLVGRNGNRNTILSTHIVSVVPSRSISGRNLGSVMRKQRRITMQDPFITVDELDTYYFPPTKRPPLFSKAWFLSYFGTIKNLVMNIISTAAAKILLRRQKEQFKRSELFPLFSTIYNEINVALLHGDIAKLRKNVNDTLLTKLDHELGLTGMEGRADGSTWSSVMNRPEITTFKWLRVSTSADGKNILDFVRATVRFTGEQTLTLPGLEPKTTKVNEYWVFERPLKPNQVWRVCHIKANSP